MRFVLKKDKDVFSKSEEEIFKEILEIVYDLSKHKHGSRDSFVLDIDYFRTNDTYNYFEDLLQCVALNVKLADYAIELTEDEQESSCRFNFEDIFNSAYDEFYKSVMSVLCNSSKYHFSAKNENLKIIFKLFVNELIWDVKFLEVADAEDYLAKSSITQEEFRELLPESARDDFDKLIGSYDKAYSDFDFECESCKQDVLNDLHVICDAEIDWIDICNRYKQNWGSYLIKSVVH